MAEELANYKLQLQQVEAALLGDPQNDELIKLKTDLMEIITLQEELVNAEKSSREETAAPSKPQLWSVGDRVLAPLPTGTRAVAIINNISAAGYAITFITSGQKTIVNPEDLGVAPHSTKKSVFEDNKPVKIGGGGGSNRKEWQAERERRRMKAQKKAAKRNELETAKQDERNSWQKFNMKGSKRGLQGLKKVPSAGSAKDTAAAKEGTTISSRSNEFAFRSARGAMDSLF